MNSEGPKNIYRSDYQPPTHLIETVDLTFRLDEKYTEVTSVLAVVANPQASGGDTLKLDGESLDLVSVHCDERILVSGEYTVTDKALVIKLVDKRNTLRIVTRIYPDQNTQLEGLYRSNGNYCTQCEAEGFRRITYYLDRPDVLATFTTRIEAEADRCPVMLSNGNLVETGELGEGRRYVVWHDPFPKPCYLFALVAGDLHPVNDTFTTSSGREVDLKIYVEKRNIDKCAHAMRSLKKSMRWDEQVYGLEYDLDIFMIVAVDDFNMGAMENKGLNIFNSKYILASPETATDNDYLGIEGVVAHEYFHNWTGNRVTCRDWFQLSLKEGLTVFRDQEFSSDMNSRPVQRIDDVRILKTHQFREDGGPMAHPVRPDSYMEINNFYTVTVYNKGAEVIRMMHTLLGQEGFRKGIDLYFCRHDGQAVTCDDFAAAMADANGYDLEQFKLWYSQAGTPTLKVSDHFNQSKKEFRLTIEQTCAPTPGQDEKKPFHMPITIGLLDSAGQDVDICGGADITLELKEGREEYLFKGIEEKPVISFLRNFSAPVRVEPFQSRDDLVFLMANDSNLYTRCEASFQLAEELVFEAMKALQEGEGFALDDAYVEAVVANIHSGRTEDKALLARALQFPPETYLTTRLDHVDPDNLHIARKGLRAELGARLRETFLELYHDNCSDEEYLLTPEAMGGRTLKNVALGYLLAGKAADNHAVSLCYRQFSGMANMTDVIGALGLLVNVDSRERVDALQEFYDKWHGDPLVMDKWFALQASSELPGTLGEVEKLMDNPKFSIKNPNKVRSLIGTFCSLNHTRFHEESGAGYQFLADRILELNSINPQIGARLVTPFTTWKKYDGERQLLMRDQLERIAREKDLSRDIMEIVKKSL